MPNILQPTKQESLEDKKAGTHLINIKSHIVLNQMCCPLNTSAELWPTNRLILTLGIYNITPITSTNI
jgi:hypothetical protein